jgi:hypothetical protein
LDIMRNELEPIIRAVRLLSAERTALSKSGPRFLIIHRFWQPGTICTPGEAIAEIRLLYRGRKIAVPLSVRLLLLFDYLARHRHFGQNAAQVAAGLTVDPFTLQHGAHAVAKSTSKRRISRTAIKQQIMRLRNGIRRALGNAGLTLDVRKILMSETTASNEVCYRLRISAEWEHLAH